MARKNVVASTKKIFISTNYYPLCDPSGQTDLLIGKHVDTFYIMSKSQETTIYKTLNIRKMHTMILTHINKLNG